MDDRERADHWMGLYLSGDTLASESGFVCDSLAAEFAAVRSPLVEQAIVQGRKYATLFAENKRLRAATIEECAVVCPCGNCDSGEVVKDGKHHNHGVMGEWVSCECPRVVIRALASTPKEEKDARTS